MNDPVREEMIPAAIVYHNARTELERTARLYPEQNERMIEIRQRINKDFTSAVLRVIKGHTFQEEKVVGYAKKLGKNEAFPTLKTIKENRYVCDGLLTQTLESLPEEK